MKIANIKRMDSKQIVRKLLASGVSVLRFILLFGLGYVILYPVLYMFSMGFRSQEDLFDVTVKWIPKNFTLDNLVHIFNGIDYPKTLLNTVIVSAGSTLLLLISCSITAYGLSRFRFRGRTLVFMLVLLTIVVPQQFFVLPSFLNFSDFSFFGIINVVNKVFGTGIRVNLLDSYWVFLFPAIFGSGIRSGLYIYIFMQFFKGLPVELEEAALIDGCGFIKTFIRIIVPSAVPVFVTVFLFSLVWHWNDYQLSSMFMPENRTLSAALINLKNLLYQADATAGVSTTTTTAAFSAERQIANILVITPMVLLYIGAQRFFTESIERTGLVG